MITARQSGCSATDIYQLDQDVTTIVPYCTGDVFHNGRETVARARSVEHLLEAETGSLKRKTKIDRLVS